MKLLHPVPLFPSDRQPNGPGLQTDRVATWNKRTGTFFELKFVLMCTFGKEEEERLSAENILSGSLMRGITS